VLIEPGHVACCLRTQPAAVFSERVEDAVLPRSAPLSAT
jgi:hypothetical protein